MVDTSSLNVATKNVLQEVAKQAEGLAMGLQNAAPPQEGGKPPKSVQYLFETAMQLEQLSGSIEES